jgi:hypothetical protein|nr:MAG TPA: hypothetical protein [Crassvirales sp.]
MSKKTKGTGAPKAPTAPKVEEKKESRINVIDIGSFTEITKQNSANGLSPDRQVDLLKMMHETFRTDPHAAEKYNMSNEAIDKINRISAIGQIAVLANEVTLSNNPFAIRMRVSTLEEIKEIAPMVGVNIVENLLPAPDAEGNVEVPSTAIEVSKETKEQIKKENEVQNKEEQSFDPTKIKTKDELKEALLFYLSKRDKIFENVQRAISFYGAYLKIQAKDNKEELELINQKSRVDLLKEISELLVNAPIVINGIGNFMYGVTSLSKSPVSAFCSFRNATFDKKTGKPAVDDQFVADVTSIFIIWSCNAKKLAAVKEIEEINKNLKVLKKDEKKNKVAIDEQNKRIEVQENAIKHFDEVISIAKSPSVDFVNNLMQGVADKDPMYIKAFNSIVGSYYSDIELDTVKLDSLRKNVEQRAGIITNLFRDPLSQLVEYKGSNITKLETK